MDMGYHRPNVQYSGGGEKSLLASSQGPLVGSSSLAPMTGKEVPSHPHNRKPTPAFSVGGFHLLFRLHLLDRIRSLCEAPVGRRAHGQPALPALQLAAPLRQSIDFQRCAEHLTAPRSTVSCNACLPSLGGGGPWTSRLELALCETNCATDKVSSWRDGRRMSAVVQSV